MANIHFSIKKVQKIYFLVNIDKELFKFTMPGPYIEEVSQENTVWHRTDRKGLKQIVEKVSILPFNVQINEEISMEAFISGTN